MELMLPQWHISSDSPELSDGISVNKGEKEALINVLSLGMKTKNRKVGRWIWLSTQNEIKIPKSFAPTSSPAPCCWAPTLSQAGAMTWEPQPNASFGRNQWSNFPQKFFTQGTLLIIPISAISAAFKSPMSLNSPRRAWKLPAVITALARNSQTGEKDSERILKVRPGHCICF